MLNRREFLATTAAAGALAAFPFARALAQDAPQLQLFVPAAPGGGWDQTAREHCLSRQAETGRAFPGDSRQNPCNVWDGS